MGKLVPPPSATLFRIYEVILSLMKILSSPAGLYENVGRSYLQRSELTVYRMKGEHSEVEPYVNGSLYD
jgi:hypothetical protein